ncbi:hypothetical protein LRD69_13875 [Streptomyces sp. JH14]|uniref:hypothetical protein n=1 Tax=Streptomyces sp. JH14 TaxID=2793630 RepID=UPI0023F8DAA7|nr:hypothetical protein [Streptomyces sp. JH14]MDF6043216.1 hypothetical protein [Streptomyces sp. JH14]
MTSHMATTATNDNSARAATQALSVEQFETTVKQIGSSVPILTDLSDTPQVNTVSHLGYTLGRLMGSPLDQVLTDLNAQVVDIDMPETCYFGACVTRDDGRRFLAMPTGRDDFERDTIARYLLAEAIGLDVTPLPQPFETVVHPLIPGIPTRPVAVEVRA